MFTVYQGLCKDAHPVCFTRNKDSCEEACEQYAVLVAKQLDDSVTSEQLDSSDPPCSKGACVRIDWEVADIWKNFGGSFKVDVFNDGTLHCCFVALELPERVNKDVEIVYSEVKGDSLLPLNFQCFNFFEEAAVHAEQVIEKLYPNCQDGSIMYDSTKDCGEFVDYFDNYEYVPGEPRASWTVYVIKNATRDGFFIHSNGRDTEILKRYFIHYVRGWAPEMAKECNGYLKQLLETSERAPPPPPKDAESDTECHD